MNVNKQGVHTFSNFQTINFLLDLINSFFPSGDLSTAKGKDMMKRYEKLWFTSRLDVRIPCLAGK